MNQNAAMFARWRKMDQVFAVLFFVFFLYTVLVWLRVIGDGNEWRPGQTVLLSGALLSQALASLVGLKTRAGFYTLLAGSMLLLYFAMFPISR